MKNFRSTGEKSQNHHQHNPSGGSGCSRRAFMKRVLAAGAAAPLAPLALSAAEDGEWPPESSRTIRAVTI